MGIGVVIVDGKEREEAGEFPGCGHQQHRRAGGD
jgi:hypothetical protein